MKYLLLICLLYTVLSIRITRVTQDDKVPLKDLEVDETFKKAVELDNPTADIDSLKLLNVYKDTVKTNNYRMRFIDTNNKMNVVQEYVITDPSTAPQKKTYLPIKGATIKPAVRTRIENTLSEYITPNEISKIEMIETSLDYMYMVTTNSKDEKQTYVVSQNKKNKQEFESLGALN